MMQDSRGREPRGGPGGAQADEQTHTNQTWWRGEKEAGEGVVGRGGGWWVVGRTKDGEPPREPLTWGDADHPAADWAATRQHTRGAKTRLDASLRGLDFAANTPTEKWRGGAGECCPAGWLRAQRVLGRLKPACGTDCAVCCGQSSARGRQLSGRPGRWRRGVGFC